MLVVPVPSSTVTAGNNVNTALTTSVNAKNATGTGTTSMTINQALTSAPLFFVRSGYIWSDSTLYYPGQVAYYWSRSSRDSSNARYLVFDNGNVYPSSNAHRYTGRSLRCLYVPGDKTKYLKKHPKTQKSEQLFAFLTSPPLLAYLKIETAVSISLIPANRQKCQKHAKIRPKKPKIPQNPPQTTPISVFLTC